MSQDQSDLGGAKVIDLLTRAAAVARDADEASSPREAVVTDQIIGILRDMLLSWRRSTSTK